MLSSSRHAWQHRARQLARRDGARAAQMAFSAVPYCSELALLSAARLLDLFPLLPLVRAGPEDEAPLAPRSHARRATQRELVARVLPAGAVQQPEARALIGGTIADALHGGRHGTRSPWPRGPGRSVRECAQWTRAMAATACGEWAQDPRRPQRVWCSATPAGRSSW